MVELRSKNGSTILSAAISPDAAYLIYTTIDDIRLFSLTVEENEETKLQRVKVVPERCGSCARCFFSPDSKYVFLVRHDRDIDVFSVPPPGSEGGIKLVNTVEASSVLKDSINHAVISQCGQFLVCSGLCTSIGVWKFQKKNAQWEHFLNLPKHKSIATAATIHQQKVVVAFADLKVCV